VVKNLTRHRILGMAMRDDHMDIVHKEVLSNWIPQ
jgi:hypothetical protein